MSNISGMGRDTIRRNVLRITQEIETFDGQRHNQHLEIGYELNSHRNPISILDAGLPGSIKENLWKNFVTSEATRTGVTLLTCAGLICLEAQRARRHAALENNDTCSADYSLHTATQFFAKIAGLAGGALCIFKCAQAVGECDCCSKDQE